MKFKNIESLISDREFQDYTPFSKNINALYFIFARSHLLAAYKSNRGTSACKEHFEELVGEDEGLQNEYVEAYHPRNEFFVLQERNGSTLHDIYCIFRFKRLQMFFIRKSP